MHQSTETVNFAVNFWLLEITAGDFFCIVFDLKTYSYQHVSVHRYQFIYDRPMSADDIQYISRALESTGGNNLLFEITDIHHYSV